jgi:hypothetical protein
MEYSLDCVKRKFLNTYTVFKTTRGWVTAIAEAPGVEKKYAFSLKDYPLTVHEDPEYYYFQPRIYRFGVTGYGFLIRNFIKTYKVGLCLETHSIHTLKGNTSYQRINLDPLDINVEKALKADGPIADNLWIDRDSITFFDRKIALRNKSTVITSAAFKQELTDILQPHGVKVSC